MKSRGLEYRDEQDLVDQIVGVGDDRVQAAAEIENDPIVLGPYEGRECPSIHRAQDTVRERRGAAPAERPGPVLSRRRAPSRDSRPARDGSRSRPEPNMACPSSSESGHSGVQIEIGDENLLVRLPVYFSGHMAGQRRGATATLGRHEADDFALTHFSEVALDARRQRDRRPAQRSRQRGHG